MTKNSQTLLMICLTTLLGACGGNGDADSYARELEAQAQKHGIDADVTVNEAGDVDSVTVNTQGGGQVGQNLALPEGFPDDVPIAPNWSIMSVSPVPQGGYMVQAMTPEDIDTVLATARQGFTAAGWSEASASQASPQMSRVGFEKGTRISSVNLIDGGAQLAVQIVTLEKPGSPR